MKRTKSILLSAVMVLGIGLTGCQSDTPATQTQVPEAQEPGLQAQAPSGAQELKFVLANEPDGLDPNVTNNSFASPFLTNLFEGLVTYNESGSIEPGSAETWKISDDGLVYTFTLRDGLKWSDGSALTAEDFVYSIQRVLTPATTAQYVNMITDYVAGAAEFYAGNGTFDQVGVKAIDAKTLEITLIQPTAFFIDVISMWVYAPVQKATVEANGDTWSTKAQSYISNGPFKISEINMGEGVVLVKNENYWNAANVTLEKLSFRYIADNSTALTAYESGEVDGLDIFSIPSSDFSRLKAENAGIRSVPSFGTVFYDINCAKAPFDNPLVRKAINLAIDRESLINNVVQISAEPAYNFIAPGYAVNGKDISDDRSDRGLSPNADVAAAKAALAEAGYPDGAGFPTVQLSYYTNDTTKKVAEAVAEMLQSNLGINVEVSSNDWAIFFENVQGGDYELAAMGWGADYQHPMSFLPLLVTGDVSNNSFYSNPAYDALVNEAKTEIDPEKGLEIMKKAEDIVMNDYALLNLYYKANNFLMKDNVKGYYMTSSSNLYFKFATVTR